MNHRKTALLLSTVLVSIFIVFLFFYENYALNGAQSHIDEHADIVADALWNYNPKGISQYLFLASKSHNYQQIVITDTNGEIFHKTIREDYAPIDSLMASLNLISQKHLTSDIIDKGEIIGRIDAVWECDTIYFELFILLVLIMIYIILHLVFQILYSKQLLKNDVAERTKELSDLNYVLKLEVEEHKQARQALVKSQKRYRLIAKNATDVIWMTDMDFNFTYISPSIFQMGGYTQEEMLAKTLDKTVLPDSMEKFISLYNETLNLIKAGDPEGWKSKFLEVQGCGKDGSTIETEINVRIFADRNNKPAGILGITREITRQKLMEKKLKESEKKYRNILVNMDDGYFEVNLAGNITFFNNSMSRMLGYPGNELMGTNNQEYMDKENAKKIFQTFNKVYKTDIPTKALDWKLIKKDGSICFIETVVSLRKDSEGKRIGFRGIARDISDKIKAEQEKIKAQQFAIEQEKHALVGQIAGKMAHDFNNILGIIMGNAQVALMGTMESETKKTLELIFKQTIRGKDLTKNLVVFAKDQEPKQEFFRINEKLDLVINLLKKDLENIEIIKEYRPDVPEMLADSGMIEHALVNIFQNSIHAMSIVEHPLIIVRTYSLDDNITIEVEDNGCGILKEHLRKIYEPSFSLKGSRDAKGSYKTGIKGTGYGMANVKRYIQQHKGTIFVESEFGSGTKVTLKIPVTRKELTIDKKKKIQKKITQQEKNILLVEDEIDISKVQYAMLTQEPCNHKVDTANNGQAAMDLFDANQYDFVSLDYILKGDLNGMDVYHHIRKTNKTIPILFVSGNIEFLESIKKIKQDDTNIDHLSKPCQHKDYINSINELLERSHRPHDY
ncbi:MAG: PAS domain S-box protein [Desulfobacula sp.]|nr:PAS domain S-box protein [Desulfobacula sp.]